MPVALFLLVTSIQPAVIRGSLAALFFLTDIYAFALSFLAGIVDMTTFYRTLPLIIILVERKNLRQKPVQCPIILPPRITTF